MASDGILIITLPKKEEAKPLNNQINDDKNVLYNKLMGKKFDKAKIAEKLVPVFRIYNVRTAVLFGSYAKGEANEYSDVDIYVDSGLKGMRFVGLVESIREALGGKDVDVLDVTHVKNGSKVDEEIGKTGVTIYER